jgi:predicted Zn-dependent peptidase
MTPCSPTLRPSRAPRRRPLAPASALALLVALAPPPAAGQDLASFEAKTTVQTLDNGWTFIIVERPKAPVFSFATLVDVGGAQEVPGITGLAHMFEHMAFKGTPEIGTTDWEAEREALARLEAAYQAYQDERLAQNPDPERLAALEAAFRERQEEAAGYVVQNAFDDVLEQNGAVGVNAFTASDRTGYLYSLPANKVELFAFLESERFLHPVFREFYQERDVVQEERRLRTDSNPIGRLVEHFLTAAYQAHPYGQPVVGYMSDLQAITMTDAERFFDAYYGPSNMVTAIVGDVDAEALAPVLERYFGRIPRRPDPPALRTVEPPQVAEKVVTLEEASQPFYLEGYHKPSIRHPDQEVYDAIDDVLTRGRTSRLYRSLVRDQRLAVNVQSFSGFPGDKYPNLWSVFVVPAPGVTNERIQAEIHAELERLKTEDVTDAELERFRTRAKADLIRELDSNEGMANELADYHRLFGDWRELFRSLERIDAVTKADVRRVAAESLKPTNRTVAQIVNRPPPAPPSEPARQ